MTTSFSGERADPALSNVTLPPLAIPTVQVVPVQGPPGRVGPDSGTGSLSAPVAVGDGLVVTVTSNWGVDPAGFPYYDPAGAADADAAIASLDATGALILTKPGG